MWTFSGVAESFIKMWNASFLHNSNPLDVMRILNPGRISVICAMYGKRKMTMMMDVPWSPMLP